MPQRELQPVLCRQYTPAVGSRFMTSLASVCIPVFDEPDVLRSFLCSNRGFVWRVDGYLHVGQLQWFKDSLPGLRVPRSYSIIGSSIHDHSSVSIPAWRYHARCVPHPFSDGLGGIDVPQPYCTVRIPSFPSGDNAAVFSTAPLSRQSSPICFPSCTSHTRREHKNKS
jgi:hypothetical protein